MKKSDFIIVEKDGLYGLDDKDGRGVIACEYDKILDYDDDGYIRLIRDGIYSTINLEGKEAISPSCRISHLGVFYNGTARARKAEGWGLVDVNGKEVTAFDFKQINAHYNNGYVAINSEGKRGFMTDDGTFTLSKKQYAGGMRTRYKEVRVFHGGIAPALTWNDRWIFIDEQRNRVNEYEYASMDTVLRGGLYSIGRLAPGEHLYSAATYEGKPIIDEWYDSPLHFEGGLAICSKKHLDENGQEVVIPGSGQPLYDYGILRSDGTYLFAMDYNYIHWNDYKDKDCWFAEDSKACYLLYSDGTRRVYDKSKAVRRWNDLAFIPKSEYNNYIPESEILTAYEPEIVAERHLKVFNKEKFENAIDTYTGCGFKPLQFYYRDTDATFDVKTLYKRGRVLRAGSFLEATQKLRRPMHRVRFMIAALRLFSVETYMSECHFSKNPLPFKENIIHRNSYFVVADVYEYAGKTQILLINIPHGAWVLGKANGYLFRNIPNSSPVYGLSLKDYARMDFREKMSESVHGHSLDEEWNTSMHQPVGLDSNMQPVSMEKDETIGDDDLWHTQTIHSTRMDEISFDIFYKIISYDKDNEWQDNYFIRRQDNALKIVVGDINRMRVDCVVVFDGTQSLNATDDSDNVPYSYAIHSTLPEWKGKSSDYIKDLRHSLDNVFRTAAENKLNSIALPGNLFCAEIAQTKIAKTVIDTCDKYLRTEKITGDIYICCDGKQEADVITNEINKHE